MSVKTQFNFTARSSLEADKMNLDIGGNLNVTKKLGVPTSGKINVHDDIHIGAIYGPSKPIGDILQDHDASLKELKENSIHIQKQNSGTIEISSSHGNVVLETPESHLKIHDISNMALYVSFLNFLRINIYIG